MEKRLIDAVRGYYSLPPTVSDEDIAGEFGGSLGADVCRLSLAWKDFWWAVYDAQPGWLKRLIDDQRCGSCTFRDDTGHCISDKLVERDLGLSEKKVDMLVYDYEEGGGFWVGPRFGCVHYSRSKR